VLTCLVGIDSYAQLPEKAEDISPLLVGESIPDVLLKAVDGSEIQVSDIISYGPTVLLFYSYPLYTSISLKNARK